jgi:hypothetical protein
VRQRYGEVARGVVAGLCVITALTHVVLVFLHVAPANPVSRRYEAQITAWISPFFDQNWLLFAPDPTPVRTQILARTGWTTATGEHAMSDWIDLTAADDAAITHNPYPSRTNQNMLRRAWTAYEWTHTDDDVSDDDFARIRAEYLRNIAARRITELSPHTFEVIRLKVVTLPIVVPGRPGDSPGDAAGTETGDRILPWWNVTSDGS